MTDMLDLYVRALDTEIWPSETKGATPVEEMAPQHAISAYHKLRNAFLPTEWHLVRRKKLPMALLYQAVGEDIDYFQLARSYRVLDENDLLEACYDAVVTMDELEKSEPNLHILRRVAALTQALQAKMEGAQRTG